MVAIHMLRWFLPTHTVQWDSLRSHHRESRLATKLAWWKARLSAEGLRSIAHGRILDRDPGRPKRGREVLERLFPGVGACAVDQGRGIDRLVGQGPGDAHGDAPTPMGSTRVAGRLNSRSNAMSDSTLGVPAAAASSGGVQTPRNRVRTRVPRRCRRAREADPLARRQSGGPHWRSRKGSNRRDSKISLRFEILARARVRPDWDSCTLSNTATTSAGFLRGSCIASESRNGRSPSPSCMRCPLVNLQSPLKNSASMPSRRDGHPTLIGTQSVTKSRFREPDPAARYR